MDVRLLKYALKSQKDRHVYIGSGEKARNIPRSPLAMPFELRMTNWKDDAERDEKIAQYKVYLWKILKNEKDPRHDAVWTALRRLKENSILLCYCYPKNCHGHVIVKAWHWARDNGKLDIPRAEPPMQQTSTNAEALRTLETQARRNQKELSAEDKAELDRRFPEKPAAVIAPGPLDMLGIREAIETATHALAPTPMEQITTAIANARLDEQILTEHVTTCPDCDAPKDIHLAHHHADCTCEGCHYENNANNTDDTLMADDVPTPPKKARATRRPRLSFDEPRSLAWNEYDDAWADLAECYQRDRDFPEMERRYYDGLPVTYFPDYPATAAA